MKKMQKVFRKDLAKLDTKGHIFSPRNGILLFWNNPTQIKRLKS